MFELHDFHLLADRGSGYSTGGLTSSWIKDYEQPELAGPGMYGEARPRTKLAARTPAGTGHRLP